jgi:hypothetical protein
MNIFNTNIFELVGTYLREIPVNELCLSGHSSERAVQPSVLEGN